MEDIRSKMEPVNMDLVFKGLSEFIFSGILNFLACDLRVNSLGIDKCIVVVVFVSLVHLSQELKQKANSFQERKSQDKVATLPITGQCISAEQNPRLKQTVQITIAL